MAGIEIAQVDPSTDRLSAEKILAVQRSAYAVEAELIGDVLLKGFSRPVRVHAVRSLQRDTNHEQVTP